MIFRGMDIAGIDCRDKERTLLDPIFAERPFIRPLVHEGQLHSLFDAVARKQVLILSPWEYDPDKKHVSRAECMEMNKMAEEICA